MGAMAKLKRRGETEYGVAPRERRRRAAPAEQGVRHAPHVPPPAAPPPPHVAKVPKAHAVATVPNPRKPALVRDVHGGALRDLFEIFPDLPRPPRPAARVRLRDGSRALRRRRQ